MSCSAIAKTWRANELVLGGGGSNQSHEEDGVISDDSDLFLSEHQKEGDISSDETGGCRNGEKLEVEMDAPDSAPATRKSKRKGISEYALKYWAAHQRIPSSKSIMLNCCHSRATAQYVNCKFLHLRLEKLI